MLPAGQTDELGAPTPAPEKLSKDQVELYTKGLESINLFSSKKQKILKKVQENYPEQLGGVAPVPLNTLSVDEQVKRTIFVRSASKYLVPDSLVTGKKIQQADPCKDKTLDALSSTLSNFFDSITGPGSAILNLPGAIKSTARIIGNSMQGFVNKMTGALSDKMEELISSGFQKVAAAIFATVSKAFPMTAAIAKITGIQGALLSPIQGLFNGIFCSAVKISGAISGVVEDLLTSAIENVIQVPRCAVEQVMGALTNKIVNMVDSVVTPLLGPIQKVLGFAFKAKDYLTTGIEVFKAVKNLFSCGEERLCLASSAYIISQGVQKPSDSDKNKKSWEKILSGEGMVGAATSITTAFEDEYGKWTMFGSKLSDVEDNPDPCYTGNVFKCGAPKVEIFGGGGIGAAGRVILGRTLKKLNFDDIYSEVEKYASIAGVQITNPGSGYMDEPIITFTDSCNKGYGAYGKATIDQNPLSPTYGQVTSITMLSAGENYPVEDEDVPLYVEGIVIEDPGDGYEDGDTLDNFDLTIVDGSIVNVGVINRIAYDDLPELNINTDLGFGAILRPIMSKTRPQGEVLHVIDCVGKVEPYVGV